MQSDVLKPGLHVHVPGFRIQLTSAARTWLAWTVCLHVLICNVLVFIPYWLYLGI